MASRIDHDSYNNERCFEMNPKSSEWNSDVIRYTQGKKEIEPIIAKGNIFDGIEAWY